MSQRDKERIQELTARVVKSEQRERALIAAGDALYDATKRVTFMGTSDANDSVEVARNNWKRAARA